MMAKKPKNKHVLEIHFDTKVGFENFKIWYHGSGEQHSDYYVSKEGKSWFYVKPPQYACPECELPNDEIQRFFYDNRLVRSQTWECGNCGHEYHTTNIFAEDGT